MRVSFPPLLSPVCLSVSFVPIPSKFFFTVLPKQGSVFAFAVPLYSTELPYSADAEAGSGSGTNSGTKSRGGGADGDGDAGAGGDDDIREARTVLDGPHIEFELYGNQFCFRAADRAGRKFKHKETIEL